MSICTCSGKFNAAHGRPAIVSRLASWNLRLGVILALAAFVPLLGLLSLLAVGVSALAGHHKTIHVPRSLAKK
jgi:hypothetical protein